MSANIVIYSTKPRASTCICFSNNTIIHLLFKPLSQGTALDWIHNSLFKCAAFFDKLGVLNPSFPLIIANQSISYLSVTQGGLEGSISPASSHFLQE